MLDKWLEPIYNLYGGYGYYYLQPGVPREILLFIQIVVLSVYVIWLSFDRKQFLRKAYILLLVDYIVFLVCSTIIYRPENVETGWSLIPFWSYKAILDGEHEHILGNVLNVLVFVPVGFLSGIFFKRKRLERVIMIGASLSVVIEIGQFLFKKGFAEIDDVIHNTIGCLLGYFMYLLLLQLSIDIKHLRYAKKSKRNTEVV